MYKNNYVNKLWKFRATLLLLLAIMVGFTSCKDDEGTVVPPEETKNLQMVAEDRSELSLFLSAVEQAGLTSALQNSSSDLTVFAPNNQAFESFLSQLGVSLGDLPQAQLQGILQYHIVQGKVLSNQISAGNVTTLNNETIAITTAGGVMLNGTSSVVTADIEASNGVIHIIDEVIVPAMPEDPTVATVLGGEEDLSILMEILSLPQFAEVVSAASDSESNLTVFAPTNTYFEQLLEQLGKTSVNELPEAVLTEIVTYHIFGNAYAAADLEAGDYATLQGEDVTITTDDGVMVNNVAVSEADLEASNGFVHKIEGVLLPAEAQMVSGTVAGIAYFDANFTTLVAALREANLLNVLLSEGPYTVFAPTNEAFEAAGITDLSAFSEEELQAVLLYHVVGGNITSDELTAGPVTSAFGEDFYVSLNDNGVFINGNNMVSQADLEASNGVVHVLDGVLMPPMQNIAEVVIAQTNAENPEFTLLLRAIQRAGLAETLMGDGPFTVFAPTDEAFEMAGLNAERVDATSPEALQNVLLYHVVSGRVFSSDLTTGSVPTVQEGEIMIDVESLTLTDEQENLAGLNAEMLNILAKNGVIHVIDAILMPAE